LRRWRRYEGSLLYTFAPGTGKFFGSFTGALFSGSLTILAVFYVCVGAGIELKATPDIARNCGALFAAGVAAFAVLRCWSVASIPRCAHGSAGPFRSSSVLRLRTRVESI
jgi:hypothetical protein